MRSIFMADLVGLRRFGAWHGTERLASGAEVVQDSRMLSEDHSRFLASRRVGHLATADARGSPHLVPVCFVVSEGALYITIDQKPKGDVRALKRLKNIAENPVAAFVADRWDEDWTQLGWLMLRGPAEILADAAQHDRAQEFLRSRSSQHRGMELDGLPVIAIRIEPVTSWGNLSVE